jgi:hypothetical protein
MSYDDFEILEFSTPADHKTNDELNDLDIIMLDVRRFFVYDEENNYTDEILFEEFYCQEEEDEILKKKNQPILEMSLDLERKCEKIDDTIENIHNKKKNVDICIEELHRLLENNNQGNNRSKNRKSRNFHFKNDISLIILISDRFSDLKKNFLDYESDVKNLWNVLILEILNIESDLKNKFCVHNSYESKKISLIIEQHHYIKTEYECVLAQFNHIALSVEHIIKNIH